MWWMVVILTYLYKFSQSSKYMEHVNVQYQKMRKPHLQISQTCLMQNYRVPLSFVVSWHFSVAWEKENIRRSVRAASWFLMHTLTASFPCILSHQHMQRPQTVPQICDNWGTKSAGPLCPCYLEYPLQTRKSFKTTSEPRTFCQRLRNFGSLGGGFNLRLAIRSYGINAPLHTIYLLFKICHRWISHCWWMLLSTPQTMELLSWLIWAAFGITNFKNSRTSNWWKFNGRVCKVRRMQVTHLGMYTLTPKGPCCSTRYSN